MAAMRSISRAIAGPLHAARCCSSNAGNARPTVYSADLWDRKREAVDFCGMELVFFGTSSSNPSLHRNVTGAALRLDGPGAGTFLFDCGEGTQRQMQRTTVRIGQLSRIFISHMHGDHVMGLPSLLATRCSAGSLDPHSKGPIEIYGPEGLHEFLEANMRLTRSDEARGLRGLVRVHELTARTPEEVRRAGDGGGSWLERRFVHATAGTNIWDVATVTSPEAGSKGQQTVRYRVQAAPLRHTMPSFGFVVTESEKPGMIDVDACIARGLHPGPDFKLLQRRQDVELDDGTVVRAADVVGPARPGRRVVILGDTCDSRLIEPIAEGADVLVHEATMPHTDVRKALGVGHSTPVLAGNFARRVDAKTLILTHFSNKFGRPVRSDKRAGKGTEAHYDVGVKHFRQEAVKAFRSPNVIAAYDFMGVSIPRREGAESEAGAANDDNDGSSNGSNDV